MAGNPLVAQGVLNRIRGSVTWDSFNALNVTAAYLGREGIRLAIEGAASKPIPTMTGVVQSPEAYLMVSLTLNLLKSQALADAYKSQIELSSLLGDCTVRPDSTTLSPYSLLNCSINPPSDQDFSGENAGYVVKATGYYLVNANLWN
jgi:hypothetical protein